LGRSTQSLPLEYPKKGGFLKYKTITAIIGIVILLAIALFLGHDGALLASGFAIIAGMAGYSIGKVNKS